MKDYFHETVGQYALSFDHKAHVFGRYCEQLCLRTHLQIEYRKYNDHTIQATVKNFNYDAFNNVDLALPKDLFHALKDLKMYIGGQHFDSMHFGEVYNPFVHDMYKRPIRFLENNTVTVPLVMAGLTTNCFLTPLEHHELFFVIRFDDDVVLSDDHIETIQFISDCYTIPEFKDAFNDTSRMIVQQTIYRGPDGPFGNGNHTIRLCFNHCLIAIAFHGIETDCVKKVRLRSITNAIEKVWYDCIPMCICKEGRHYIIIDLHGTLNASLVDELYLDLSIKGLAENETRIVHVQAHSYEIAAFRDGLAGLMFTG